MLFHVLLGRFVGNLMKYADEKNDASGGITAYGASSGIKERVLEMLILCPAISHGSVLKACQIGNDFFSYLSTSRELFGVLKLLLMAQWILLHIHYITYGSIMALINMPSIQQSSGIN